MVRRILSIFFILFMLAVSVDPAFSQETDELREKTKQFYHELYRINSTLRLDIGPLLSMLDPNVVVTHQGPRDASAPFYKTYETSGYIPYSAFFRWVLDIMRTTTIETFIPEYTSTFDELGIPDWDRYMMVEGNVVYSHVLEGGHLLKFRLRNMFNKTVRSTNWAVDNLHLIYFNDKGLIEKLVFISHSESFMDAVDGVSSSADDFEYSQARSVEVADYPYEIRHNKGYGLMFINQLAAGNGYDLDLILAEDAVCQIPGSAPFCGIYYGIDEIAEFIALFSSEVDSLEMTEIVSEGNKAGIRCTMRGSNSETGSEFYSKETVFSFQFNAQGKVVSIFCNYDTYAVGAAY